MFIVEFFYLNRCDKVEIYFKGTLINTRLQLIHVQTWEFRIRSQKCWLRSEDCNTNKKIFSKVSEIKIIDLIKKYPKSHRVAVVLWFWTKLTRVMVFLIKKNKLLTVLRLIKHMIYFDKWNFNSTVWQWINKIKISWTAPTMKWLLWFYYNFFLRSRTTIGPNNLFGTPAISTLAI